ncbi:MAG: amidohydrolase family protein [Rhodothalassiaceae bacterium]
MLRLLCLFLFAAPVLAAEPADLIIHSGQIVTMDAQRRVLDDGVVVVRGSDILAVGGRALLSRYDAAERIDAQGGIVMPGMINLHNHLPMVAFRGIGEYAVENIVLDVMFPLEKALLSRELIRIAARHAAMELALAGTTLVTDMYYHEDAVARSVAEVGIRGVLGETVIGFPVVDAPEPYGGLAVAEAFIRDWQDHALITPAVAPHSPYTVGPVQLKASLALAERYDVPVLIHLAEFRDEPFWVAERHEDYRPDGSLIAYLDALGVFADRVLAAHVIHVDAADRAILKRHGVGVAHNPKANSMDATGLAPGWEMRRDGLDIGLGTDGPMSSNQLDILTVMSHAAAVARARQRSRLPFTPADLVELATLGGARALDREAELGSLEPGKRADIVILETQSPNMQPNYDPYATIVFAAYPGNVTTTIVHGRVIVRDRKLLTVDLEKHRSQWQAVTQRVRDFAKTLPLSGKK